MTPNYDASRTYQKLTIEADKRKRIFLIHFSVFGRIQWEDTISSLENLYENDNLRQLMKKHESYLLFIVFLNIWFFRT